MPPVFRDAVIIALTSCFSRLLEYCILEDYGSCLLSSHLQFGFKPGLSTTMCTGVLKAVISRYLVGGSCVYSCLVDASKAFDTVDHTLLLEKLLRRNLPIYVVRFLLSLQRLRVSCNGVHTFPVSRGARQGVQFLPFCSLCILMICYMNLNSLGLVVSGMTCLWVHSLMLMTLPC